MISFQVTSGFTEDVLKGLETGIDKNVEEALDKSAAAILNRLRTTYLAEQDPYGQEWIPSHAGMRRRKAGGTGTLFDSGNLFRSIQLSESIPGLRVISSDVPYGVKHNDGLEGMLKREFMAITDEHQALAESIFEDQIKKLLLA